MEDSIIYLDGLSTLFVSDLSQPAEDLYVRSAGSQLHSSDIIMAQELLHVELLAPIHKFLWLYTMKNVTTFRDSYSAQCNLPAEPDLSLVDVTVSVEKEDDLSLLLVRGGEHKVKHPLNGFQKKAPQKSIGVTRINTKEKYKLVFYQRDRGRLILNAKEALASLRLGLPEANWEVIEVIHNEQRPPCELMRIINSASVMVTSHGFQSTLLLYQPRHSTIAEIHTSMMYIPNFYGDLQVSFRQSFGFAR